jgi:hypothetical protein
LSQSYITGLSKLSVKVQVENILGFVSLAVSVITPQFCSKVAIDNMK